MKVAGLRLTLVLALQVLWAGTAHAQLGDDAIVVDEATKQRQIYRSRGADVPQGYVIDRSLSSYLYALPEGLDRSLAALGPNDRWLDIGAGEGRAILDYSTSKYDGTLLKAAQPSELKGQAVAMSIEDRRTNQWYRTAASLEANQIQYLFGKRLREYSLEEIGRFRVITDVMGGFSYTRDLSLFMEKTLAFLETGGSFYTLLQDVRTESGTNRPYYENASFLTEIAQADGSEVRMCWWLKRIACVEVTCEAKPDWTPPLEVYRIRKTCDDVKVPGLKELHFQAGTPPERGFQLSNPPAK